MIWLTSDWHFNHDREFIWKPRGFKSVGEMNFELLARHNMIVSPEDTVYVLGDLMLGEDSKEGLTFISRINGHKIVIAGNHDTKRRREMYERELGLQVLDATTLTYNGYHFYLSHYPTLTANLEKESLKQCTINLYGHTHQIENFYNDIPFMYHVGVDSHGCAPVSIDQAIKDMKAKVKECKEFL